MITQQVIEKYLIKHVQTLESMQNSFLRIHCFEI